jgi:hypothetical protein
MGHKTYLAASGTIFGIITILHLARIMYGWPAQIGSVHVPTWASWLSLLVAGYLAITAFILLKK